MHKFDHTELVTDLRSQPLDGFASATFDTIYLSTKGRPQQAFESVQMLVECDLPVIVIISSADDFPAADFRHPNVDVKAINLRQLEAPSSFVTHRFSRNVIRQQTWDVYCKRNAALMHARQSNFQRVLFIDDDVRRVDKALINLTARTLDSFDIAGCVSYGHFDNSVVGHASRMVGLPQTCFLSSNFLAVKLDSLTPMFPPIYNEDWLFMFERVRDGKAAIVGEVEQLTPELEDLELSAEFEEPGEVIAEGLYASLHEPRANALTESYWAAYLHARQELINSILAVENGSNPISKSTRGGLIRSLEYLETVTPNECLAYLELWNQEKERWLRQQSDDPATTQHSDEYLQDVFETELPV